MINKKQNNSAYIDGANLHKGMLNLGWDLDYKRFRILLKEKYNVEEAFIFIGLIPKYKELYSYLQECGYILIFKEVVYDFDGKAKGNCDADLVLKMVSDFYNNKFEKSVIVTSDGDYASLVKMLFEKEKLRIILSPAKEKRCSILLKRIGAPITYINDLRGRVEYDYKKEKAPDRDGTL
uniref:NYN domain-containing protein n=1 Tax=candidate division CPR3 bacterium TaxID=2268181 RepID=A0A7C4M1B6_UNCC3